MIGRNAGRRATDQSGSDHPDPIRALDRQAISGSQYRSNVIRLPGKRTNEVEYERWVDDTVAVQAERLKKARLDRALARQAPQTRNCT